LVNESSILNYGYLGGTLFFAIRGYRAIILTGAFQQITPNVGGVLSTIFNREKNTPENTVNRRHFFNVITLLHRLVVLYLL
jgi:hypothetical protein